jgi:O-antigen/teichoic acid export membrane protein
MVYGLGSILPRVLNYLIFTPFYTRVLKLDPYGTLSEMYAYIMIVLVIIEFGMESGFFRHARSEGDYRKVFSHTFGFILIMSIIWLVSVTFFSGALSTLIQYREHPEYVIWIAWIIALDSIALIPFAKLRHEERALRFSILKLLNVAINVVLVFTFLWFLPILSRHGVVLPSWLYNPNLGVGYVFICNLATSAIVLILLLPELRSLKFTYDGILMRKIIRYSAPLVIVGIAGAINDSGDKIMLKFLYPDKSQALAMVGEYSASYRIAILMTLFTQMFRYAFEPFLFSAYREKNAPETYAGVMNYFVLFSLVIFLGTTLYIDIIQLFIGKGSRGALAIVPIVLLGYLFLGIYYNLSVWYKVKDLTRYAAVMAITGAVVTLILNFILVPKIGYMGSAWATMACYLLMMIFSYLWGKRIYPVPYNVPKILIWISGAVVIYFISVAIRPEILWIRLAVNTMLILLFLVLVGWFERPLVTAIVSRVRQMRNK